MRIPLHWAEARARERSANGQVTVRRFGWSDASEGEARVMAEARAKEALARIASGEKQLSRRDLKVPYNGSEGVPIREEILAVHLGGKAIVTRNSYGAHCLNVENVLFADIDHARDPGALACVWPLVGVVLGALIARALHLPVLWAALAVGVSALTAPFLAAGLLRTLARLRSAPEVRTREKLERFLARHTDWRVRLYRTPAGMRILALHETFDPTADADLIEEFFRALGVDPIYRRMCKHQQCFRARLTAKPWRIGIPDHMRPRPGVWPVAAERRPLRDAWIADYERTRESFAACAFLEDLGSERVHPSAEAVRELHDRLSGALSGLPIA